MFDFLKYNHTDFEAGGLLNDPTPKIDQNKIKVPFQFIAPRRIDSRDMCLSSSNQYQTPNCAGYTMAGYIEYYNWKTYHYPAQVNGDMIYAEAKKNDGNNRPGTTLKSAVKAAINLNLIQGEGRYVDFASVNRSNLSKKEKRILSIKFALHQYGVVISGFMITNEWDYVDKKTGFIKNIGDKAKKKGGHAVLLCGYDDSGVYIQNSWGDNWGHYGFAIMDWDMYYRQFMRAMVVEQ
jgi:hypothetical protein